MDGFGLGRILLRRGRHGLGLGQLGRRGPRSHGGLTRFAFGRERDGLSR